MKSLEAAKIKDDCVFEDTVVCLQGFILKSSSAVNASQAATMLPGETQTQWSGHGAALVAMAAVTPR